VAPGSLLFPKNKQPFVRFLEQTARLREGAPACPTSSGAADPHMKKRASDFSDDPRTPIGSGELLLHDYVRRSPDWPQTRLIAVRGMRVPGNPLNKGTFWLDDVQLTAIASAVGH
jgi:hypothetical protein